MMPRLTRISVCSAGALLPLLIRSGLVAAATTETSAMSQNPQHVFQRVVDDAVAQGEMGLQIAVYKDGKCVADVWGGVADKSTGRPVERNTLFNVFLGKTWTCVATHVQAERGLLDLDRPVASYWPEFAANGKEKVTAQHILSHRSGVALMPEGVTPERLADYDWMIKQLEGMKPLFEPGTQNAYEPYTQGWLLAEIIRRTDPQHRRFCTFFDEEICKPLGIEDMGFSVPKEKLSHAASHYNAAPFPMKNPNSLYMRAMPASIALEPRIFGLPVIRTACLPGVGAITSASSHARFWAMLAGGGELDGVRLLSEKRVRSFLIPQPDSDKPDPIVGIVFQNSNAGLRLAGTPGVVGSSPHILAGSGAGNNIAWADLDNRLAVAIGHTDYGSTYHPFLANALHQTFKL